MQRFLAVDVTTFAVMVFPGFFSNLISSIGADPARGSLISGSSMPGAAGTALSAPSSSHDGLFIFSVNALLLLLSGHGAHFT